MTHTVIIYCSKTGFSQRYAQWLAEDTGAEILPYQKRGALHLDAFDTIILVGGLYAGTMRGLPWLKKQQLAGKRAAAVAVGASPADSPELAQTMEKLFAGQTQIRSFYCRGGLDYARMGAVDRAMMAGMRAMLRRQGQEEALRLVSASFDAVRRENLAEIERWLKECSGE